MDDIVIVDMAALTALGDLNETWQGLLAGRSGLVDSPFPGPLGKCKVGPVPGLSEEKGMLPSLVALLERLAAMFPDMERDCLVVAGSTKGAVDELLAHGSPWSGQPWDLGRLVADAFGVRRQGEVVSAACASGTIAIINGIQQLLTREADVVTAVGIDLVSRFVVNGFLRLQALASGHCRPFDRERDGLCLGEGAAALVLMRFEDAKQHDRRILARIKGWGAACDAVHITAPCRQAGGLLAAIRQAIGENCKKVGAINGHGTGTIYNDAMEMHAFSTLWPDGIPFHSVKGGIGHCLGAAGVIETALAVKALEAECIPPTVGLRAPEQGMAMLDGQQAQPLLKPSILTCNSGFGGINAALLLDRP